MRKKITLKNAPTGVNFLIDDIVGDHCLKLREKGFCEGLCICKLKDNKNILCNVCGTKYAISQDLSSDIKLIENQSEDHDQSSSSE
jgi:ferrous iron transport protein A